MADLPETTGTLTVLQNLRVLKLQIAPQPRAAEVYLGFRGGDAVLSVNEEPVTSISQAVEAYRKLRNKKKLRVKIRRNKKELVLEYTLVE
ncbi:hypothetical protein L6R49_24455 [Myxococcota bacterium]|nr:hypothetical protein [Myxococcota bacterium]